MTTQNSNLRRMILDAARQYLVEEGYQALSMRKISRQVGCSVGTIYLYFKNKDEIFHALIDEGFEQLYTSFQAVLMSQFIPIERLQGICQAYIEFGLKHPEYYEIMYLQHPMMAARYPKEQYRRARRFLEITAETIADCARNGGLPVDDPYMDATLLWSAMHGITSLLINGRIDVRLDRAVLITQATEQAISRYKVVEPQLP